MVRIIIAGDRDFTDGAFLFRFMDKYVKWWELTKIEVVSGTCRGADKLGETWAMARNHQVKQFKPNWNEYGLAAGPIRNRKMAIYASKRPFPRLVAFSGGDKGTASMIEIGSEYGLLVTVVNIKEVKDGSGT